MDTPTRALASKVALADAWAAKGRDDLRQTREDLTLVITEPPGEIFSAKGRSGVDFRVKLFVGKEEIPIDGHRRFIRPPLYIDDPEQPADELGIAHLFPELWRPVRKLDPVAAAWNALWDAVFLAPAQENWGDPFGTTTTVFASTADGYVSSTNATYATARSGSGLAANTTSDFRIGQSLPKDYLVEQAFVSFDTSAIDDGDTVSAIVLSLWLTTDSSTTDFITEARESNWGASVTTADFIAGASLSGLTLMASINSSGIGSTGAYKDFTSEAAFLTATNLKTGTVYLNLSSSRQRGNNAPTGNEFCVWESADTASTTNDPKLTVTHSGNQVATIGLLALTLATFAPTVTVSDHQLVTPGVLALLTSLFAPVASVSDNKLATPDALAISLATFAPTVAVSDNQIATPGVLAMALSAFAPVVTVSDNKVATPGVLAMALTTFAVAVAVSDNQMVVPDVLALLLATFAPTVTATANQLVTPDVLAMALTAFAPDVTIGGNQVATPGTLALVTAPFAPVVTATEHQLVTPDVLSLTTSPFAPLVTASDHKLVTPDKVDLVTTGFAPTIAVQQNQLVTIDTLALAIMLYAPTVTGSQLGGGSGRPGTGRFIAGRPGIGRFLRNQPGVGR